MAVSDDKKNYQQNFLRNLVMDEKPVFTIKDAKEQIMAKIESNKYEGNF